MIRSNRRRPPAALIIAVLALIASLAGVAAAQPEGSASATAKAIAKKAKKKANKANKKAKDAKADAAAAQEAAESAQGTANAAQGSADGAAAKVAGTEEIISESVSLANDTGQDLFTIGNVTLNASCGQPNGSQFTTITANVDAAGPVLVVDGFETVMDPQSVDIIVAQNTATGSASREASFAVLDGQNSFRGVAAIRVDFGVGCEATAHGIR